VDDVAIVCPNQVYVKHWQLVTLEPCSNIDMLVEVNDDNTNREAGPNNNQLAFELQVGGNFVVYVELGNEENSLFWVLMCVRHMFMYKWEQPFTDDYNFTFENRDEVAEGHYYKKIRDERNFICDGCN
jgi:hypothetical protein